MKEIKAQVVHNEKYDININQYLTYAQIQQIVNAVEAASKEDDSWSARQTNIDMLVLYHATDIGKEKLEEIGHEALVASGLVEEVNMTIYNYYLIEQAIDYTESMSRAGFKLISQLPSVLGSEAFAAVLNKYGAVKK